LNSENEIKHGHFRALLHSVAKKQKKEKEKIYSFCPGKRTFLHYNLSFFSIRQILTEKNEKRLREEVDDKISQPSREIFS
jgi:hypothetical protein